MSLPLYLDAEVLDGARLGWVPWVRGVNLHVFKANGLVVHRAEYLFIVDKELEFPFSLSWDIRIAVHLSIVGAGSNMSAWSLSLLSELVI